MNFQISSRTAFLCVHSLSSPLSNSLTLTFGVIWNQPEKVKLNCPLFYLLKRFCMYRRRSCFSLHLLVKCIARIVGFLSPPVLCASPTACIPFFHPPSFPALLNPTPPLAGTAVCPSPFLADGRSSVHRSVLPLSLPYVRGSVCILPWPVSLVL